MRRKATSRTKKIIKKLNISSVIIKKIENDSRRRNLPGINVAMKSELGQASHLPAKFQSFLTMKNCNRWHNLRNHPRYD
jgi:hypothetical protein